MVSNCTQIEFETGFSRKNSPVIDILLFNTHASEIKFSVISKVGNETQLITRFW
jgi:hypothetical protein